MSRHVTGVRALLGLALVAVLTGACSATPILANAPVVRPVPAATASPTPRPADPQPVVLPRDDGPHDRLTEWWYDTGHLVTDTGRRFGFEFVIFRAERGSFPVTWASHLALTDEQGNRFAYAQRTEIGPQVDRSPRGPDGQPQGFALALRGFDPSRGVTTATGTPWTMQGASGHDHLSAAAAVSETTSTAAPTAFALDLDLASDAPAVLHNGIGYIDFGPGGGSYYYSRPRLSATGTLTLDGQAFRVTGDTWFDHQWGDFISVGGGWDWFAVNLADGTDLTLSLVRDASGADPLVYGTLVRPDGTVVHLDRDAFQVTALDTWTSPHTQTVYPAGWHVRIPSEGLDLTLEPTLHDQELDTRSTTGVVYWEGSQQVTGTRSGTPIGGEAYVELTGYGAAPAGSK